MSSYFIFFWLLSISNVVLGITPNTNIQSTEFKKYVDYGKKRNYTITTIIVENRNNNKNIHSVPTEVISNMKSRFEIML